MSFCIADASCEVRAQPHAGVARASVAPLRVLFVTPYLPSPPRFGGQRRLDGLIAGLARHEDVSVLSFVEPAELADDELPTTRAYCRHVATLPRRTQVTSKDKRALQLRSVLSSRSYEWLCHETPGFAATFDDLVLRGGYDVVHFEFPFTASHGLPRKRPPGAVFLLDEHNIEFDIGRQTAAAGAGVSRRLYHAVNWRKIRAEEGQLWAGLDGCTVTSARDQEMLLSLAPRTRTAVVPNAVDLEGFCPTPGSVGSSDEMLFFGAVDYYPNTDGLLFFLDRILPRIRVRRPSARLSVVGRRPPPPITAWHGRGVTVTGAVPDVRPHIQEAAVVVVPLRLGGGTRLKILEAMAMGKAIVSTSVGAHGLDIVPERELRIADDPDEFAAKVAELLADPARASRLGAAARRFVEERHGWKASVATLRDFYRDTLDRHRPGQTRGGEHARGAQTP